MWFLNFVNLWNVGWVGLNFGEFVVLELNGGRV